MLIETINDKTHITFSTNITSAGTNPTTNCKLTHTKDIALIRKTLFSIKKLKINKSYKILIISKNFSEKNLSNIKLKNKIILKKFVNDTDKIYRKTYD